MKQLLGVALSVAVVVVPYQVTYGQQGPAGMPAEGNAEAPAQSAEPPAQNPNEEPAPESAEQIQALVSPIALYPDALVAQILSGATFPDQISLAENWLQQHQGLTGKKLMNEVNKQSWDPSVKALT